MAPPLPLAAHPEGVVVEVWVVPGAARSGIAGLHDGALRVRVSVPPEAGRANRAAARLVAAALGGRGGEVVAGPSSRRKQVLVRGVTPGLAAERLNEILAHPPRAH